MGPKVLVTWVHACTTLLIASKYSYQHPLVTFCEIVIGKKVKFAQTECPTNAETICGHRGKMVGKWPMASSKIAH